MILPPCFFVLQGPLALIAISGPAEMGTLFCNALPVLCPSGAPLVGTEDVENLLVSILTGRTTCTDDVSSVVFCGYIITSTCNFSCSGTQGV